jgi:hypothetical protein
MGALNAMNTEASIPSSGAARAQVLAGCRSFPNPRLPRAKTSKTSKTAGEYMYEECAIASAEVVW